MSILARAPLWSGNGSDKVVLTWRTWSFAKGVIVTRSTLKTRCDNWRIGFMLSSGLCRREEVGDEVRHNGRSQGTKG
jgi:hypothetical protein